MTISIPESFAKMMSLFIKMEGSFINVFCVSFREVTSILKTFSIGFEVPDIGYKSKEVKKTRKIIFFDENVPFVDDHPSYYFNLLLRSNKIEIRSEQVLIEIISKNYVRNYNIKLKTSFEEEISANVTICVYHSHESSTILYNFPKVQNFGGKAVGNGSSGWVYASNDRIYKVFNQTPKMKSLFREFLPFYIMDEHENIIKLKGWGYNVGSFVLELENGGKSLFDCLKDIDSFNDIKANMMKIIMDICKGIIHLSNYSYIHRDLRLPNVVWDTKKKIAKIIDFGLNRHQSSDNTKNYANNTSVPPEAKESNQYDYRVDVYNFGIMIKKMLEGQELPDFTRSILENMTSKHPFERPLIYEVAYMIMKKKFYLYNNGSGYEYYVKFFNKYKFQLKDILKRSDFPFHTLLDSNDTSCILFHKGFYHYMKKRYEKSSELFLIGKLLNDEYCCYFFDYLAFKGQGFAKICEINENNLISRFCSFEFKNFRTYLLKAPKIQLPNSIEKNCENSFPDNCSSIGAIKSLSANKGELLELEINDNIFHNRKNKIEQVRRAQLLKCFKANEYLSMYFMKINSLAAKYYAIIHFFETKKKDCINHIINYNYDNLKNGIISYNSELIHNSLNEIQKNNDITLIKIFLSIFHYYKKTGLMDIIFLFLQNNVLEILL